MVSITESFHTKSPYGTFRLHLAEDPIATQQRAQRQKISGKFPATQGIYDVLSFQERDESNYKIYNEAGERRADAPRRQNTPVVDPTSGFTSVGADAEDGRYTPIDPLVNKDHRPQSAKPYGRPITSPIPELRTQNAPWESQNKGFEHLGSQQKSGKVPATELMKNKEWRDAVATRSFYTSQTQRLYNGVDWANSLPPALDPPSTTLEFRPDMVSQKFSLKRYDARPAKWQELGCRPHSWDYTQSRNGHYIYKKVDFCSPSKKVGHIPGYTGCTSGYGERDYPGKPFGAITLVRSGKPRYTDTARKGNIPGYTGCVLFTNHHPSHSKEPQPKVPTTARVHRTLQVPTPVNLSPFNRTSAMSKMVTLVHPFNPYNKID
ncbi:spermatogenesis-associated protein 48 [Nematostella vectensis]|uniref:spermatogenesis-associated protein 48 n=1 Tax=Nematostella vectensis TaxID=45351 RepID=UPI00138FCAE2|nr:spermatogenesis-associated protein 48 [Nematostella vectensis]